jgi:ribosome-associated toxin RatA of RatAB toxin-antitoxin module
MKDIKFEIKVPGNYKKLYELFIDFKNYKVVFPRQLKHIEIISEDEFEATTKEILVFNTFFKNTEIHQTTKHIKKIPEINSEIIEGPFKNSKINVMFIESDTGTTISCEIKLKIPLKYKILSSIIKNKYKLIFTSVIYQMNNIAMSK